MLFGLTRGELTLIGFVFALVYGAGHLPKLVARLAPPRAGGSEDSEGPDDQGKARRSGE